MTTPSSSSLLHALNPPATVQKSQGDPPRLQLAPPEHQKHFQPQAHRRQEESTPHATASVTQRRSDDRATPLPSSREISSSPGVETTHSVTGDKRKPNVSHPSTLKRRRTDQAPEELRDVPVQYGLGTLYPYPYAYPGAPPPPPLPTFHPPPAFNPDAEMGFNEFQWRLLNLCAEFYEAATELIRATPPVVLSQAFQLLSRGTGLDPISVLNDARRTCDMLLANPHALSAAPPPPVALSIPILTSLAHLNSRAAMATTSTPAVPPSYYPPPAFPDHMMSGDNTNERGNEKERHYGNAQGTWKEHEVQKLKALTEKYRVRDKMAAAEEDEDEEDAEDNDGLAEGEPNMHPPKQVGDVDWEKVVAEFGDERPRHQVLVKATYLGLKPSSAPPGKKPTRKKVLIASTETTPPIFSGAGTKTVSVAHSHSQLVDMGTYNDFTPAGAAPPQRSSAGTVDASSLADPPRVIVPGPPVPPAPPPQLTHAHAHAQYAQPSWYPPQNPYYPYPQPVYYPPHPQSYGIQGYGMHAPPQQGYYGQSYLPPPPPVSETIPTEKQAPTKSKRKESRKSNGPTLGVSHAVSETTVVASPSAPPKQTASETSANPVAMPGVAASHNDAAGSTHSTPKVTPAIPPTGAATAPPTSGSSGVLRRGPTNSLFTYTPLPHGPGGTAAEQSK